MHYASDSYNVNRSYDSVAGRTYKSAQGLLRGLLYAGLCTFLIVGILTLRADIASITLRWFYGLFAIGGVGLATFLLSYRVVVDRDCILIKYFTCTLSRIAWNDIASIHLESPFEMKFRMKCGKKRTIFASPALKSAIRDVLSDNFAT